MSFLAPGWLGTALLGLLAASIPIIIHFLFKTRYHVVPWAAMQFLRKSLEKTTRRIKFQELLLLLLRIALLLLLAFALMRPSSSRHSGQSGAPVDAVFILDTSGSMAVHEAQNTRLELSKIAALRILDSLPAQSTLHIVQAAQKAEDLGPASSTNRDQARYIIQQVEQTHASAPLLDALQKSKEILSRGSFANKEVYLFSDMQRHSWDLEGPGITAAWSDLQQLGEVVLVHAGHGSIPANAALLNLRPQVSLPLPNERVPFTAEIRNTGNIELQGLTVTLRSTDNERDIDTQPVPVLKPGETVAVTLTTRLEHQGKNIVSAELHGDQLAIDNRLDYLMETREQLKVLIIDGQWNETDPAKSASYFLAHALRSAKENPRQGQVEQVQLTIVPKAAAYPALLADTHVCFLVGLSHDQNPLSEEFLQRLASFAHSGGGVIFFAGNGPHPSGLENWPGLPCKLSKAFARSEQEPLQYDVLSIPGNSFLGAFRHAPLDRFAQTETISGRTLAEPSSNAQIILKYSDGQPAIILGQHGQGSVIIISSAADLLGTDAPLRPSYVPFIQALVSHVLTQQTGRKNLVAGERYTWTPPLDLARQRLRLISPSGVIHQLGIPKLTDQRAEITTDQTSLAGVYRILPEGTGAEETGSDSTDNGDTFVVVPDPLETADLTTLTQDQLNERFSRHPVHVQADSLVLDGLDRSRVQREWTEMIFWFLLIACLTELTFAWFCNRSI